MISLWRRFQDVCLPIPRNIRLFLLLYPLVLCPSTGHLPSSTPPPHKYIPLPPHSNLQPLRTPRLTHSYPGYIGKQATPTTNPEPIQSPVVPPSSTSTTAAADFSTQLQRTSISSAKTSPPPLKTPSERSPAPPPPYGLAQAEVLYNYHSQDEGDLNLVAGQRITIVEFGMDPEMCVVLSCV